MAVGSRRDEDSADLDEADFSLLAQTDSALAERLVVRFVDRWLVGAGLRERRRDEAILQTRIEEGKTADGRRCALRVTLPLGSGIVSYTWDGSATDAEELTDDAADVGIADVVWDRENVRPTGWEPEYDVM